ncbi:MAG: gliding motility-associated C-terminal domain-containing protein [Candidatus Latescibacteria bacterium]|nr:gliding motility-associated C-terminal domain-containing protein [Candidatus Latescibacterota bacterium]
MLRAAYILAALLIGFSSSGQAQVQRLKIGGNDGLEWEKNSLIFNALEVTDENGLSPLEADPEANLLPRIKELGGTATTSVRTAAARSNQILKELIDEQYTTGWRVYTNTNGAELEVDMGAVFVLQRIFLHRGVLNDDERSLRGYEFYVNDGDSLNFIGDKPVYSLIAQDRSHGLPELDLSFSPTQVRYFKLRSTGERGFQMGDLEVFGLGVTPFAQYISRVIDLGDAANLGPVNVYTSINGEAKTQFSTKTGYVANDSLYFSQTGIPGEFEEVSLDDFDRTLDPSYAGIIRENTRDWSTWSPPYAQLENAEINAPDNRRYFQFQFKLLSGSLLDKAVVDSVVINYTTPAIADSVIAEISPTTAILGQENDFTYHLRSVTANDKRGFDTVIIRTPFAARATGLSIDGIEVNDFTWQGEDGRLQVAFPNNRITRSGQAIDVRFTSLMTISGTEFRGEVADSQSDAFPQRIIFGNANEEAVDNTLVVSARIDNKLFTGVDFSSDIITPNGDGINDQVALKYVLLKATDPVGVQVIIYDLSGREVRRLYKARDSSGPNQVAWDGRADDNTTVPPGLYLIRLEANTDAGDATQMRSVAVVY